MSGSERSIGEPDHAPDNQEPDALEHDDQEGHWWRRRLFKSALLLVLSLVIGYIVVGIVGAIDWAAVGVAFSKLDLWVLPVLILLLLVRQTLNAIPIAQFTNGLGTKRAVQNDLAANLVGTVAPPPGDVVLRVGMFQSWKIDPVEGMAGVSLNMIVFYSARFLAPLLGLILIAFDGVERRQVVIGLVSGLLAAAILIGLILVMRSNALAKWMGESAGSVARRVKKSLDTSSWGDAVVEFRGRVAHVFQGGVKGAYAAMLGAILVDALILLLSLRAVGVSSAQLSWLDVFGTFMIVFPLTIMPLFGFGVLDAALVGAFTTIAGLAFEPTIVAGVIIWRVVTLGGPLLLGLGVLMLWRRSAGKKELDANELAHEGSA